MLSDTNGDAPNGPNEHDRPDPSKKRKTESNDNEVVLRVPDGIISTASPEVMTAIKTFLKIDRHNHHLYVQQEEERHRTAEMRNEHQEKILLLENQLRDANATLLAQTTEFHLYKEKHEALKNDVIDGRKARAARVAEIAIRFEEKGLEIISTHRERSELLSAEYAESLNKLREEFVQQVQANWKDTTDEINTVAAGEIAAV